MIKVGCLVRLTEEPYECIRHVARDMGFRCGQLSIWNMALYSKENADIILRACEEFNFTITAVWCGWSGPEEWNYPNMYNSIGLVPSAWRSQRVKEILKGAAFAHMLGVQNIITHIGFMPDNPNDQTHIEIVQAVRYICKQIAKNNQRFLFETGEMIPNTLIRFLVEIGEDNVGVNFDTANMVINARANSVDALRMLVPYVCGMHAKDAVYPQGTSPNGKEVKIGDGVANFPVILRILADNDYNGSITIEREIEDVEQREKDILESKIFLENIICEVEKEKCLNKKEL